MLRDYGGVSHFCNELRIRDTSVVSTKYIVYFVSFRGVRPNEVQGGQACPEPAEGWESRRNCAARLSEVATPFGLATTRTFGIPERAISNSADNFGDRTLVRVGVF